MTAQIATKNETYTLKTGEEGAAALESQSLIFREGTCQHLEKAGLCEGETVLEVGCGTGCVTQDLAKFVGPTGHVYALDFDADQIHLAKKRIDDLGYGNVTFLQGDIHDLDQHLHQPVDFVYGRLILMHTKDPQAVLKKSFSLLKSGGMVAFQESIFSDIHDSNASPHVQKIAEAFVALSRLKGIDYNIGNKLEELCQEAGFQVADSYRKVYSFSAQQTKERFGERLNELQGTFIKENLATEKDIETWKDYFQSLSEEDTSYSLKPATQSYIIAKKA